MCEPANSETDASGEAQQGTRPARLKIWQIEGGLQCAIIGTCLSHQDLVKLGPRVGIDVDPAAPTYDVHGYFVNQCTSDTPVARGVQKLLDRRFKGILGKVQRETDLGALTALWETEYAAGRVPGAFWAFVSSGHVPPELAHRVWGEVHMLSHLLGKATHVQAARSTQYQALSDAREHQLTRLRERHAAALAARDEEIEALKAQVNDLKVDAAKAVIAQATLRSVGHPRQRHPRMERALVTARERARLAELALSRLNKRYAELDKRFRATARSVARADEDCPGAAACQLRVPSQDGGKRLLYLGGRRGALEQLRAIAARTEMEFIYHDGGIEDGFQRIEGLIARCDAVFCPVDCISHGACQHAKELCRRHCKSFVALRSSGGGSFERALEDYLRAG